MIDDTDIDDLVHVVTLFLDCGRLKRRKISLSTVGSGWFDIHFKTGGYPESTHIGLNLLHHKERAVYNNLICGSCYSETYVVGHVRDDGDVVGEISYDDYTL